jgi:hypothetical protein
MALLLGDVDDAIIWRETDIVKSKYVVPIIDLEKITHFVDYIVRIYVPFCIVLILFVFLEKNLVVQTIIPHEFDVIENCFLIDSSLYLIKPFASFGKE